MLENRRIALFHIEHTFFECIYLIVKVIDDRHIQIDDIIQYLVQKICSTAPAGKSAGANLLLHYLYRTKPLVVIGHYVVFAKIAVELFRNKIRRAGFAGFNTVYNKIKMVRERLNFGLVARLKTIFNRERVKMENLEHDAPGFLDLFRVFA